MIDSLKNQFLSTLDPKIVYICLAVLGILIVLTLIKKAIKFAVGLVVVAVLVYMLIPAAREYQDKFSINIDGKVITLTVDGKSYSIGSNKDERFQEPSDKITSFLITRESSGEYTLKIGYQDNNYGNFKIPGYMKSPLLRFLEKQDIKYKLVE